MASSRFANVRSAAAAGLVVPACVLVAILVAVLIGVLIPILVGVLALVGALALVLHEGVLLSCGLLWG